MAQPIGARFLPFPPILPVLPESLVPGAGLEPATPRL